MSDWRDRLRLNSHDVQELSDEGLAVTRIMKSLNANRSQIGDLCRRFEIPYDPEESTFNRAVKIFRYVVPRADLIQVFDVKSGNKLSDVCEELMDDQRTAIVFFRIREDRDMSALIRSKCLPDSALGKLVISPGIRYISNRDDVQIWQHDPVKVLRSLMPPTVDVV